MDAELREFTQELRRFSELRDWKQFHSPKNLATALAVEAGELLEHFQWLSEIQSKELPPEKREDVAGEVADVLIYLLQFSDSLGIDPLEAAKRKLALNDARYPIELSRGNSRKHTEFRKP